MALKSGYKGFKKLLGLKTIRPGTLAVDDAALANTFFPRSEQAVLGAKNLLPLTFSGETQNDVVFTVDSNGIININGTNSGEAFAVILSPYSKWLKDGRYFLSGCSGGSASTYKLDIDVPSGAFATNYDGDTEFTMVNGANNYRVRIVVYAGAVMNNVKIKPMIRLASDTDPTYVPYAMTNEQLTDKVQAIINAATNAADFAAFKTAMGAITAVTRTLQVTPETREEITESEDEPEVKKTTRKKSTANADTVKEGE